MTNAIVLYGLIERRVIVYVPTVSGRILESFKNEYCYFVGTRGGKSLKIGTTSNIVQRMKSYHGYILYGVTDGYYVRELQLHSQFNHIWAGLEDYFICGELLTWIYQNSHFDVPDEVWKHVKKFDWSPFKEIMSVEYAEFRELNTN